MASSAARDVVRANHPRTNSNNALPATTGARTQHMETMMQGFRAIQRYFDFSGRSGRAEFWQFVAIMMGAATLGILIDYSRDPFATPTLMIGVFLALLIPFYAVTVRRLHDRNRTGWWVAAQIACAVFGTASVMAAQAAETAGSYDALMGLYVLFTIANGALGLFLLVQVVLPGDDYHNRYGAIDKPDAPNRTSAVPDPMPAYRRPTHAPQQQPQPAPAASEKDPVEQIERLARLRDSGALTDDEFATQKAALLKRL